MTAAVTTLADLTAAVVAFRDERDWQPFHTPKNLSMAIMTEAAELAELYVWQREGEPALPERIERSAEEMADVLIYLLSLADALDVDLAAAVRAKLVTNAARYPADEVRGTATKHDQRKLANTKAAHG
jgi:NTP pyrophosphatase (non-canonical NTP hydrolase)